MMWHLYINLEDIKLDTSQVLISVSLQFPCWLFETFHSIPKMMTYDKSDPKMVIFMPNLVCTYNIIRRKEKEKES